MQCHAMLCYAMCYMLCAYPSRCHTILRYVGVLCSVLWCYAMRWHAIPCHAMLCYVMLCHAMLFHSTPCRPTLCRAPCNDISCFAMSCYATLWHAVPCCALPPYVILGSTILPGKSQGCTFWYLALSISELYFCVRSETLRAHMISSSL